MAGEGPAIGGGTPALLGHNPASAKETKRICADDQGSLQVDANVKSMAFTWNADNTCNTIDVVRVVNGADITKRITFTWAASKLTAISASIV